MAVAVNTRSRAVALSNPPRGNLGQLRLGAWLPIFALLAGLVGLIYLIVTSSVATAGYDMQRLEAERAEWRLRNEQLELELAKLSSVAWVEHQALTRLEMQPPEKVTFLAIAGEGASPILASTRRPGAGHLAAVRPMPVVGN